MATARDRQLLADAARVNADAGAALVSMLDELEDGELRLDALREVALRLSAIADRLLRRAEESLHHAEESLHHDDRPVGSVAERQFATGTAP